MFPKPTQYYKGSNYFDTNKENFDHEDEFKMTERGYIELSHRYTLTVNNLVYLFLWAACPRFQLLKEIVSFVVYKNKCREVFYLNFINGFHTKFRIFHTLYTLDATLR